MDLGTRTPSNPPPSRPAAAAPQPPPVDPPGPPIGWAVLELLGHRREIGYLSEEEIASTKFLRLATPVFDTASGEFEAAAAIVYFSTQAVYAITPSTEEAVLAELRPFVACGATGWRASEPLLACDSARGHDGDHDYSLPF